MRLFVHKKITFAIAGLLAIGFIAWVLVRPSQKVDFNTDVKPILNNKCIACHGGVRYVQLFDWGWDAHGDNADNALNIGIINKYRSVDKPITALLLDLKQRGMLEETLVVWGGEFGRTPMMENRDGAQNRYKGRDHHTEAFTIWMAGGGIKKGFTFGETDEIGYSAVSGKVEAQATILNQLGFDHEQFTYYFQGRPFRLTDVAGKVIQDIIA